MAERFAAAMPAAVELVFELNWAVDVPAMELDAHYRPDYPDAVPMTVAQLVNRLIVAAAQTVAYRFAGSMMQRLVLDSLGLVLAPTSTVAAAIVVGILPIPWMKNYTILLFAFFSFIGDLAERNISLIYMCSLFCLSQGN